MSSSVLSQSVAAVDQSIDTMNLNEFDYVEEIKAKATPQSEKKKVENVGEQKMTMAELAPESEAASNKAKGSKNAEFGDIDRKQGASNAAGK